MSAPIVQWICQQMSKLLGFEAPEDIANYLLTIEQPRDLEDYMYELLDASVPQNKRFIDELLREVFPENNKADSLGNTHKSGGPEKSPLTKYQKHSSENDSNHNNYVNPSVRHKSSSPKGKTNPPGTRKPKQDIDLGDAKKKNKFVPLFSEEGEVRTVAKLPGRIMCDCLAGKHSLINNCIKCGRIVCEQEGSGPCLFCSNLVCTREEQEVLNRGSKKSVKLRQQLMNQGDQRQLLPHATNRMKDGFEKALSHKDTLLEYDRTVVKRTQVIDDESDYFATDSNQWLNQAERELLRKREEELRSLKHVSKKDRKITLDFAGRCVIEEKPVVDMYNVNDEVIQNVHYGKGKVTNKAQQEESVFKDSDFGDLVNPTIAQEPPKFIDMHKNAWKKPLDSNQTEHTNNVRIQDAQLQEMSDQALCLSMHQPWASLLILGIKKHEGRTWYSAHRGRLWIAATTKPPVPEEITQMEEFYKRHYNKSNLPFPKDYPTSCLLGCVNVTNVMDQDAYREEFPDGESTSPYVFVCEDQQELIVKFPMKGKHKIYKLDHHIHQGARKGLRMS